MPKIKIDKAFNFREAGKVDHYPKGSEPIEVSAAAAQHAWDKGFAEQPKPAPAKPAKVSPEAPVQEAAGK
ncbi:glycogen branching protein [Pseudomonas citronellolis]|uniref:hypothetical protein n=1 Tax=Pseudomonas citronellolis TaxID=53408 RepID=UPI00226F5B5F|nr:glycogen branching protein [Pseudomonas citronellolis]WAB92481.1 glycogen branching protein [Pseudomonas citronellolis]